VPTSDQDPIPVSLDGRTYAIAPGSELTVDLPVA
jgi:hypothetical protein